MKVTAESGQTGTFQAIMILSPVKAVTHGLHLQMRSRVRGKWDTERERTVQQPFPQRLRR